MSVKLVVIGDSHTGALYDGCKALVAAGRQEEVSQILILPLGRSGLARQPFFTDRGDHIDFTNPEFRQYAERLPIPGMEGARIGLSLPLWPMRLVMPMIRARQGFTPVPPRWTPVSSALFRRLVLEDQRYILELIDRMQALGIAPLAVSGPGLFRDHPVVRSAPQGMVLALDRAYRATVTAELAAREVPVVDVPAECLDAEGYMLPAFRHEDPDDHHHANVAFGQLMVERLLQVIAA